jgi:phosphoribosylamine---glycine ligase
MKILVIGSGAREHALCHAMQQSPLLTGLHAAPGNPGIAELATCHPIAVDDIAALLTLAKTQGIDLTVVGPELPLSLGIVDAFEAEGLLIFGPSQAAAQLEASKAFAKQLMQHAKVPTGAYIHALHLNTALEALNNFTPPYVIKEDGLAAGKGVTVALARQNAEYAIHAAFAKGMTVVIEDFLPGEELSLLAVCDGKQALPLVPAQDFKRAHDGDTGPNTGGMGAYAPVPWATPALINRIQHEVLNPVLAAMAEQGTPYKGILYAGLMIAPDGTPNVVEFNARFGDPETQVVLPLLAEDIVSLLMASAQGDLSAWTTTSIAIKPDQSAVTVVLAAKGYPSQVEVGQTITTPPATALDATAYYLHAGTKQDAETAALLTAGGRVISVLGLGENLTTARHKAYTLADAITFEGKHNRQDIAQSAAERQMTGATQPSTAGH